MWVKLVCALLCALPAQAGFYELRFLHPGGKQSMGLALDTGIQGGYATQPPNGTSGLAATWKGTAESYQLYSVSGRPVQINDIRGARMVGTVSLTSGSQAVRWNNFSSFVPELPSGISQTFGMGISATQMVGWGISSTGTFLHRALLWADIDNDRFPISLNPPGYYASEAYAVDGGNQAGYAMVAGDRPHAMIWSSTAESAQDVNPPGYELSNALDVRAGKAVGYAQDLSVGESGGRRAVLWNSTSSSAVVVLHPAGAVGSEAVSVANGRQVGEVDNHAALWSGTAESFEDLHSYLPPEYESSRAMGIDDEGNIIGYAHLNTFNGGWYHAVMWAVPEPGSISVLLSLATTRLLTRRRASL